MRIVRRRNLNPARRHRSYPRVVKRARHNHYRVKKPTDTGTRHQPRFKTGAEEITRQVRIQMHRTTLFSETTPTLGSSAGSHAALHDCGRGDPWRGDGAE